MSSTLDKLYQMRTSISDPDRWWGGAGTAGAYGGNGRMCLLVHAGECHIFAMNPDILPLREAAWRLFPERATSLVAFNHHPDTTHADVLMVIDAAIVAAGGEPPMSHPERTNMTLPARIAAADEAVERKALGALERDMAAIDYARGQVERIGQ